MKTESHEGLRLQRVARAISASLERDGCTVPPRHIASTPELRALVEERNRALLDKDYAETVRGWWCREHGGTPLPLDRMCPDCVVEERDEAVRLLRLVHIGECMDPEIHALLASLDHKEPTR